MTVSEPVQLVLRLAVIGLVTVLLQLTLVSPIGVLGTNADLLPLVVSSCGLLAGSVVGAGAGFAFGMLADLTAATTLGVSALVLVPLGYAAGRLREVREPHHPLVPLLSGAVVTLAYAAGTALIQLSLGVGAPVSPDIVRDILAVTFVNAVIALPVHWIVRRVLRGTVPQGGRRRRRAYTTGGLSPLSTPRSR